MQARMDVRRGFTVYQTAKVIWEYTSIGFNRLEYCNIQQYH